MTADGIVIHILLRHYNFKILNYENNYFNINNAK